MFPAVLGGVFVFLFPPILLWPFGAFLAPPFLLVAESASFALLRRASPFLLVPSTPQAISLAPPSISVVGVTPLVQQFVAVSQPTLPP
jgi:hypothetical protein